MSLVQSLNDYCFTVNILIIKVDVLCQMLNWNEMVQWEMLIANNRMSLCHSPHETLRKYIFNCIWTRCLKSKLKLSPPKALWTSQNDKTIMCKITYSLN
jgi:hypothetical protein